MQTKPLTPEQKKALAEIVAKSSIPELNGYRVGEIILDEIKTADLKRAEIQLKEQVAVLPNVTGLIHYPEQEHREFSIEEIKRRIDKETLYLFAFVPFVIAEIAWDYADSCIDLAILLRLYETKRLSRHIRELRRSYDRKRYIIDRKHRQIETENMLAFQEDYKEFFSHLHHSITEQVNGQYPGQCSDMQMLIAGAYSCAVVLRSLFKYADIMSGKIASLLGITARGSIIVDELRQLAAIILQYAGEESIGGDNQFPSTLNVFVDTLVEYLLQSEIIELPCPVDEQ